MERGSLGITSLLSGRGDRGHGCRAVTKVGPWYFGSEVFVRHRPTDLADIVQLAGLQKAHRARPLHSRERGRLGQVRLGVVEHFGSVAVAEEGGDADENEDQQDDDDCLGPHAGAGIVPLSFFGVLVVSLIRNVIVDIVIQPRDS